MIIGESTSLIVDVEADSGPDDAELGETSIGSGAKIAFKTRESTCMPDG